MRSVWLAVAVVFGGLCACSKSREPEAGSQTHFLSDCDDSCPSPYSCLCGVCTLPCDGAGDCKDAHDDAVCAAPDADASACGSSHKQCDVECSRNADCAALGTRFSCEAGHCRQPSGGTSGSGGGGSGGTQAGNGGMSGSTQAGGGGTGGSRCSVASDCVLVAKGCCGVCQPTKTDVDAVLASEEMAAMMRACPMGPVACGPCPPVVPDPQRALLRAACEAGQCTVIDLREQPEAECKNDDDCKLVEQGCCGSCGPDPTGWVSLAVESDPYAPVCDPIPPCTPCTDSREPETFCADDGHCAVRELALLDGTPSTECYSPWHNADTALDTGARGCDCGGIESGASTCVQTSTGDHIAMSCMLDHWTAFRDGPCKPAP